MRRANSWRMNDPMTTKQQPLIYEWQKTPQRAGKICRWYENMKMRLVVSSNGCRLVAQAGVGG